MTHELKTINPYFSDVASGQKQFEIRKNDRDFKLNDELLLREYDPELDQYTGRQVRRKIIYILQGERWGIQPGYMILGIKRSKEWISEF